VAKPFGVRWRLDTALEPSRKYASLLDNGRSTNRVPPRELPLRYRASTNNRPVIDRDQFRIPRNVDQSSVPKLCYSTALQRKYRTRNVITLVCSREKIRSAVPKNLERGGETLWSAVAFRHRFGIESGNILEYCLQTIWSAVANRHRFGIGVESTRCY
jgi:hypothetical protein